MAWIESHTVIIRHRKTVSFALELGIKPVQAMGHLHALWHSALEQAEDGDLSRWSSGFIAAAACWDGDADKFCQALTKCGWMTEAGLLHDWLDYVGRYLRDRYHSKNKAKLVEVWAKHSKGYGESTESPQKVGGNPVLPNLPNLPNIPNLPNLPESAPKGAGVDGFLEFWRAYPKKVGRAAAAKSWKAKNPPLDKCLATLAWQTKSPQWLKVDPQTGERGKFIPHPATWLNQGRWADERVSVAPGNGAAPIPGKYDGIGESV